MILMAGANMDMTTGERDFVIALISFVVGGLVFGGLSMFLT